jgi:hypothetical protein
VARYGKMPSQQDFPAHVETGHRQQELFVMVDAAMAGAARQ